MAEREAKFRLKSYVIDNASIKFDRNNIPKDLKVDIQRGGNVKENNEYHYSVVATIEEPSCGFELKATCSAIFEFDRELTNEERSGYFSLNAPAILFPYIRAYISTLTSLSGISPIVLPTINLAAHKE